MNQPGVMQINVAKILKDKAPNARIPSFVLNFLRRIVHEEEINAFLREHSTERNVDFMESTFRMLGARANLVGRENLPRSGACLFVSNHPLGGLDGVALGYLIGREYDDKVLFVSNDLLMNLEPIAGMFIPVNKVGGQSKSLAGVMNEAYRSENQILSFPAGVCSRKMNGQIRDLEWKKSFVSKAVEYQRDVVPLYFEGQNSAFFYNLARFRKALGIKFNIEMMFLADEMFKQRNKEFTIRIGKPIPWQTFDKSKTQYQWAQWVKEIVYSLNK